MESFLEPCFGLIFDAFGGPPPDDDDEADDADMAICSLKLSNDAALAPAALKETDRSCTCWFLIAEKNLR
jgi:hypothetical protein